MGSLFGPIRVPNPPIPQVFNPYASGNPAIATQGLYEDALNQQVQSQNEQAAFVIQDSGLQQQQIAREAVQFREQQAMGYNSSGVLLAGSPLVVLNQTRQLAQQQVDMLAQRAQAQSNLLLRQAMITQNEGRAQLLGQNLQFQTAANNFSGQQITAQAAHPAYALAQNPLAGALMQIGTLFGGARGTNNKTVPTDPLAPNANPYNIQGTPFPSNAFNIGGI